MKFGRVLDETNGAPCWVTQIRGELVSTGHLLKPDASDIQAFITLTHASQTDVAAGKRLKPECVQWLAPIERPGKVICLGLNYAAHAKEGGNKAPDYPAFFLRSTTSLLAHGAPLVRPKASHDLDFEAELAVVIGRRTRHATAEDALESVAGYSCFNDGTLRDYQRKSSQWTIGKNFDRTGGFGPWLVPAADLPTGAKGLRIEAHLNGKTMQSDNTDNMIVSVAKAIMLLSDVLTLEPGDVIAMGTPSGVGYARSPPVWLRPGDQITIAIERIGVLTNPVSQED
jgi:acylpyruvate hydrolase